MPQPARRSRLVSPRHAPPRLLVALIVALIVALVAISAGAQTQFRTQTIALAAGELPGSDGASERLAILSVDETTGGESILARLVARTDGGGRQAGERIGDDLVLDGAGIWGTAGTAIDVEISSFLKPGHLFVLLDTLELVEIRGIWGTDGTAGMPAPEDVKVHGPLWGIAACGKPTSMAEGLRRVANPEATVDQPFLAIGTADGCVGLAGIDQDSFEEPVFALGNSLVGIWGTSGTGYPVRDLVVHPTRADWGVLDASFTPSTENHVPHEEGWGPDAERWIPATYEWIPTQDSWYEIAASSGDRVFGIFPGVLPVGDFQGVPAYSTYTLEHGSDLVLTSVVTERPATNAVPVIAVQTDLAAAPVAAANGSQSVHVLSVGPGTLWGTTMELNRVGETPLAISPFDRLASGSLWVAASDGRSLAFLPAYDAATGEPGTVRVLDDLFSAKITPRAINRKSNGNFVTAVITGDDEAVLAIQPLSARLTVESVEGDALQPLTTSLEEADGGLSLILKFDRQELHRQLADFVRNDQPTLRFTWSYGDQCGGAPCTGGYSQTARIVK